MHGIFVALACLIFTAHGRSRLEAPGPEWCAEFGHSVKLAGAKGTSNPVKALVMLVWALTPRASFKPVHHLACSKTSVVPRMGKRQLLASDSPRPLELDEVRGILHGITTEYARLGVSTDVVSANDEGQVRLKFAGPTRLQKAVELSTRNALLRADSRVRYVEFVSDELANTEVISPFARGSACGCDDTSCDDTDCGSDNGHLKLTSENVELVLDKLRPYLVADGGNVALADIDGSVVKLELQGACGNCVSSETTMKMGLERGLREKIPEISSVERVFPDASRLTKDGVEKVLDKIRPFLKMTGSSVSLVGLQAKGMQPTLKLAITGSGSEALSISSVRAEIVRRLKSNFPTLANVVWE